MSIILGIQYKASQMLKVFQDDNALFLNKKRNDSISSEKIQWHFDTSIINILNIICPSKV